MFPTFNLDETQILTFALVLVRISAFVIAWPVFSVYSVPGIAKVLFALVLATLLFPVINKTGLDAKTITDNLYVLLIRETLIGLILGFVTRMFFYAIAIGGNLVGTSMGLASAQMFNPTMESQSPTVEQFYVVIATLFFLAVNGHYVFLTGLSRSFEVIPLGLAGPNPAGLYKASLPVMQEVMLSGLQVSAPVLISVFVVNLAMGIIGRAVPQINVLVTSLPINVMVGLTISILVLPMFFVEMDNFMKSMAEQMFRLMKGY
jgi:flagellar biosynthesis protein FliR